MTQEDKQLLTKDLCSRLDNHLLLVKYGDENYNIIGIGFGRVTLVKPLMSMTSGSPFIEEVKPYLRRMQSITDKEIQEIRDKLNSSCTGRKIDKDNFEKFNDIVWFTNMMTYECVSNNMMDIVIDYLDNHMLDHRNLIEKGLALEATEDIYQHLK